MGTPKGLEISDYSAFYQRFAALQPSRATLLQCAQILSKAGASIRYLSQDWRRVGIAGTMASLASVPTYSLQTWWWQTTGQPTGGPQTPAVSNVVGLQPRDPAGGVKDVAAGAFMVVPGMMAAGAAFEKGFEVGAWALYTGTLIGAGILINMGIHEMFTDNPTITIGLPPGSAPQQGASTPPFDPLDAGTSTVAVLPQPPTDAGDASIPALPVVNVEDLPVAPPESTNPGNPGAGDPTPPPPPTPPGGPPTPPPPPGGPPTPPPPETARPVLLRLLRTTMTMTMTMTKKTTHEG